MGSRGKFRATWVCGFCFGFGLVGSSAFGAGAVVLDGSYGASGPLAGPNFQITAAMGRQIGPNLFHSFGTFNLVNGESATFSGPANIQNILARVTGGSPSSIDGTINSSIAGANLFLLNPSGVMFGPNAQVNVTGSFVTGSPDYVKLADGGMFFTSLGGAGNLTSAPISAFGFLSATPAPVSFSGSQITAQAGTGLHVIGGDITLDGAALAAPSGGLTLFSAASVGEVPFSLASPGAGYASATNARFGNIRMINNASAAIDGNGGGKVVIRGGHLVADNSAITSIDFGGVTGGDISIQADHVAVQDQSLIASFTLSSTGGNVAIQAGSLSVDASSISSESFGTGNAGSMNINVTGAVSVTNSAQISAAANASGNSGDITIHAGSLNMDGMGAPILTGIADQTLSGATGNGGVVNVDVAGGVSIVGGAAITGTTSTAGQGGDIVLHAGSLLVDGSATPGTFTGIVSTTDSPDPGAGSGGSVTANIDGALTVVGHGEISSGTFSDGNSGNVVVNAGGLTIQGGTGAGNPSGIFAQSSAAGMAGTVTVNVAGVIGITGLGEIDTSTFASGPAGNVTVRAQALTIDGSGSPVGLSGIGSTATSISSGPAGSVDVGIAGALTLANGAVISSASTGTGPGGSVLVAGGNVSLMGRSAISASAVAADAGTVGVSAVDALSLTGGSSIDTTAGANGGNITLTAGQLIYLLESQVTAQAGLNGGNITMGTNPPFVVLDQSLVSANAALGQGGNITITSRDFLNDNAVITATGTTNGTILISSPDLDLSGSLLALPANLVSEQDRLREKCARAVNHEFSTFIVVGRGGTEAAPEEYQPDFGL